jgi:uncharacterized membrane protein YidH (DUF202 family)
MAKTGVELKRAVFLLVILLGSSTVKADILEDLGGLNTIMFGIAAGLAALVIVIQAIKWKTSDSKLERDQAKRAIINVVLGLIIILIAVSLVGIFYGTTV